MKPLFKVTLGQWIAAQCTSGEDDGTSSKPSSKAEKDDLAAQGMKRPIELKRLELAAFLGRTVSESETAKGSYRGMPQSMEGGKLAVKFQHPTLDTRIKLCRESGTLNVLGAHYTNLAAEMTDCGEAETERQSTRVLQFWSLYCVRVRTACPPARERRPPVVWGSMWAMWGVGASTGSGRCERVV